LRDAIRAISAEVVSPEPLPVSREQLVRVKDELERMLSAVETNRLPPRVDRNSGLGRVIVDSWPFDWYLGEVIISAAEAYREL
jgi:hypothetical protein